MKTYLKNFVLVQATIIFILPWLALSPQARAACVDGCNSSLFNTFQGDDALIFDTTGAGNTAFGWRSLFATTDGSFNTGVGGGALVLNNGTDNTAVGAGAMLLNIGGNDNTAVGTDALVFNDFGSFNDAVGSFALFNNVDGDDNNAFGNAALVNNIHGSDNTAIGDSALHENDFTGNGLANGNTAVGAAALAVNVDGSGNTAVGFNAGSEITGDNNIDIGNDVTGVAGESNTIRIGNSTIATTIVRGIFNKTSSGGIAVLINSDDTLGTMTSSARFKQDIKPMDKASEALFALKPVAFRYKKEIDPLGTSQFGLVAEDVEEVNSDLVVRDKEGKPYSVRYEAVNAMLLNEFLKEHKTVQEQGATITRQRKDFEAAIAQQQREIEALTASVKEQAAQIQKVSTQIEVTKPAPRVVNNP